MEIKKTRNNLQGRKPGTGCDMVDTQIVRWRRKMAKEGRVLGRHMKKAREKRRREYKDEQERALVNAGKKPFFE